MNQFSALLYFWKLGFRRCYTLPEEVVFFSIFVLNPISPMISCRKKKEENPVIKSTLGKITAFWKRGLHKTFICFGRGRSLSSFAVMKLYATLFRCSLTKLKKKNSRKAFMELSEKKKKSHRKEGKIEKKGVGREFIKRDRSENILMTFQLSSLSNWIGKENGGERRGGNPKKQMPRPTSTTKWNVCHWFISWG